MNEVELARHKQALEYRQQRITHWIGVLGSSTELKGQALIDEATSLAKTETFGLMYGMGPRKLIAMTKIKPKPDFNPRFVLECADMLKTHLNNMEALSPGMHMSHDFQQLQAQANALYDKAKDALPQPTFNELDWECDYELDPITYKVTSPGKFEGNHVWVVYVWERIACASGADTHPAKWFIDGERGVQYTAVLDGLEMHSLGLMQNTERDAEMEVLVWETEQGFVHGIELTPEAKAAFEKDQQEIIAEIEREERDNEPPDPEDPNDPMQEVSLSYAQGLEARVKALEESADKHLAIIENFKAMQAHYRSAQVEIANIIESILDGEKFDVDWVREPFGFSEIPIVGIQLRLQLSSNTIEYRGRDSEPWQMAARLDFSRDPHYMGHDGISKPFNRGEIQLNMVAVYRDGWSILCEDREGLKYFYDRALNSKTWGTLFHHSDSFGHAGKGDKAKGRYRITHPNWVKKEEILIEQR
jgi:hypothetical protein